MSACLFCRIVAGDVSATIVAQNELCMAFRDIGPQAPTHIVVIPKAHCRSLNDLGDAALAAALFQMAREVANAEHVDESGYRVVINTGRDGGQSVDHLHLHVLGGRAMHWPPG